MMKHIADIQSIISDGNPVFDKKVLNKKLTQIKEIWGYMSMQRGDLINLLTKNKLLVTFSMTDNSGDKFVYYYSPLKKIDIFDIAIARSPISYFSFYTALSIHGLTLQIPKQIYLTCERTKMDFIPNQILTQSAIDKSFNDTPRITQNKRITNGYTINLINGQFHNKIGVITYRDNYSMTNIERTLIDIVVRPFYAGGVTQVLEAFINAKNKISIKRLLNYYMHMKFLYPYHQAIGFYLEKANYPEIAINAFQEIKQDFRFYLTYNMNDPLFSEKWNLYYPKGL